MKLIIDTDPGVDDAMAIFYAHGAPDIDLLGLTTVFGNVHVDQASRNARHLLDMVGSDIPVAQGADQPHVRDHTPSKHVHGDEGLGHFTDIPENAGSIDETAAEFLVRMAREHAGELVICAIAPLTNIADAFQLDPDFAKNVARIVIMGGAVDCPGNITPHAEANVYHDPHAAEVVFASGANLTLVGLDVTLKTLCTEADFNLMAEKAPITGGFLRDIGLFYLDFYKTVEQHDGCGLHDSTAVIACTHPQWFTTAQTPLAVELSSDAIGATRRTQAGSPVSVCLDIDANAVKSQFMDVICKNP